ncbi:LPXTG cell wall anchor domain-containing protein [Leifsonia sp. NPDC058194]|uniref:COG1470 family protein n=1 Tax=Leifsonia sp. NPDC058194 TaxID=3346374 RepID=UPI0036DB2A51
MPRPFLRIAVTLAATLLLALPNAAAASAAVSADGQPDGTVTWMVRPSDGTAEDGRSWVEHELDPGASVDEHLLIRNLSKKPVTFTLTAADGYFTDTGRFNMLTSDRKSVDAGTWITIQPTVDVAPGADVVVPFTVTVPENATPGDHAAGVAASIRSGTDDEVGVESRVGFRVMTRVAGELTPRVAATIGGSYDGSWNPFEAGSLKLPYTISNTGNTRLSVKPVISAHTLFGLVSVSVPGDTVVEIAPGETRTAAVTIPSLWPAFLYSVDVSAKAAVAGASSAPVSVEPATATGTIPAVPWSQLIVIAIAVLLVWWLWRDRRRRDAKVSRLVEQARQEGRAEAEESSLRRHALGGGSVALVVAVLLAVVGGGPARAATDPAPDNGSISVKVDIRPTQTPTSQPGAPGPTVSGDLAETGSSDWLLLALAAGGAVLGGAGLVGARRSRVASRAERR